MRIHSAVIVGLYLVVSATGLGAATVPERNVNMVSGTEWPGGDPFLQRQNEPSIAVSTRNPLHLLAGANDYRTVDIPGLEDIKVIGDAWLGIFRSYDGGNTWTSTLLPGYPQDASPAGMASPLKGYPAGADPVMRAGANGIFYFAGITLTRDENPLGAFFVARYLDHNDKESSHFPNEESHAIRYVDTTIIQKGTSGQFNDKPWLAVDIPRAGSAPCTVAGQTLDGGNVYAAWTILVGGDENVRSRMVITRSTDCGATWQKAIYLSETHAINQGASIAIDPRNGNVYVVWRRIRNDKGETDALLFAKSTDFGQTFSKAQLIREITPFEQGTHELAFRTTMFPSMTVDGDGRIYIVWSQRNAEWRGRIAMITSTDATNWSEPVFVANEGRGHQFMPTINFAHGKLTVGWYDQTEDHTRGIYAPIHDGDKHTGQYTELRQLMGHLDLGQPEQVFRDFIIEYGATEPLKRRHTLDVYVSQADPGVLPVFQTHRASRYYFGSRPAPDPLTGEHLIEQMQYNPANLPLFRQGTTPFIGDYIDISAAETMVKDPTGWRFRTEPSKSPTRHLVWTDNRDVRPPADGNWRNYTPVGSTGGTSVFDASLPKPACVAGQAGMRNQNIYTTRVTDGLFAGSPGNTKPFFDEFGDPLKRAFVVFVQNALQETKTYRLELVYTAPQTIASFLQFEELPVLYVSVPPRSTVARTVFAVSALKYDTIQVNVEEAPLNGDPLPDGLSTTVILNPDIANPDIANPDIANPDIANPDIANAEVYNPDIANPDIANPDIANPDIANPDIANPDIANPDIANPDIANPDIANPDIANPDIANPDIANESLVDGEVTDTTWEMTNGGNTTASYSVKLLLNGEVPEGFKLQLILYRIYTTPVSKGCSLELERHTVLSANINNPKFTPAGELLENDVADSSEKKATIWALPGETVWITLRVVDPIAGDGITFNAADNVVPVVVAHAVNTLDAAAGVTTPSVALTITTFRVPDAIFDVPYTATLEAIGGSGSRTWTISEGVLPKGITLNSETGTLSGTTTATGRYDFTAVVSDAKGHSDEQVVRLDVVEPLEIVEEPVPTAALNQPYSFTFSSTGGAAPFTWTLAAGALPAGLTFSPHGVISGTPTETVTSSFTVRVEDGTFPTPQARTRDLSIEVRSSTMFLHFVNQPASVVEGTSHVSIGVQAQDASGAALSGVSVTLTLGQNPCNESLAPRTATTNEEGVAQFALLPALESCYGYTYRASAEMAGFSPGSTESNVFDVYGFSDKQGLPEERGGHTATVLNDGRVLVAGGRNTEGTFLAAAHVYDPANDTWSFAGNMQVPRWEHTATLLPDGKVLIAGGLGETPVSRDVQVLREVETYDPTGSTFTLHPETLAAARRNHTATLRPNGSVIIVGGESSAGALASIERFADGTITSEGAMSFARANHTATLVGDTIFVIGGGSGAFGVREVEIILPTGAVATAGTLAVGRVLHSATVLETGMILVAGGYGPVEGYPAPVPVASTELYNPDTQSAISGPLMNNPHTASVAARLPDGTVLIAGGSEPEPLPDTRFQPTGVAELFNQATGAFTGTGRLSAPRTGIKSVVLTSPANLAGKILAIGGVEQREFGLVFVNTVELFLPGPVPLAPLAERLGDARNGVPYSESLHAIGGIGTRTWSFVNGSLPLGITLSADGTLSGTPSIPTNSSAEIHGFTARVTDSAPTPTSGTQEYVLRVVNPLTVPPQTPRIATLGVPYTETLIASGGASPYVWSLISGSLPAGLTLSSSGIISGTCTATGGHSFTVEVTDDTYPWLQSATGTLSLGCDFGVLEFVTQLQDAVAFQQVNSDVVVRARDTMGFALASIELTLSEPFQPCGPGNVFGLHLPRTATTDAAGEAHFGELHGLRGCYDITVLAGRSGFNTARSNLFDVFGFGDQQNGTPERLGHTATLLIDGRILIAGGMTDGGGLALSAQVYDPVARTLRFVGNLNHARMFHTATLLNDGKVLIAGGHSGTRTSISSVVAEAELFDPSTDLFTVVGSNLIHPRTFHTATLYPNGKVFLAGGRDAEGLVGSIEVYDPDAFLMDAPPPAFSAGAALEHPRIHHTATLIDDRIVIIGGLALPGPQGTAQVEVIESATSIASGGTLVKGRTNHTATLLNDGQILVVGGFVNDDLASDDTAELYSLTTNSSTEIAARLPGWFANHLAARLTSGKVVIAGGSPQFGVVLYDPASNTFESYGHLTMERGKMAAVFLSHPAAVAGRVIAFGGELASGHVSSLIETFFPER